MTGFIERESRAKATLFPERLDDYIAEESPVRVIDVFVDELDLESLGFKTVPEEPRFSNGFRRLSTLLQRSSCAHVARRQYTGRYQRRIHYSPRRSQPTPVEILLPWAISVARCSLINNLPCTGLFGAVYWTANCPFLIGLPTTQSIRHS